MSRVYALTVCSLFMGLLVPRVDDLSWCSAMLSLCALLVDCVYSLHVRVLVPSSVCVCVCGPASPYMLRFVVLLPCEGADVLVCLCSTRVTCAKCALSAFFVCFPLLSVQVLVIPGYIVCEFLVYSRSRSTCTSVTL